MHIPQSLFAAEQIVFDPSGIATLAATDVQAAIAEVVSDQATINSGLVPYTGASADVDLGVYDLSVTEISNDDGDLKIQEDANADIKIFDYGDMGASADGKKLYIYRKEAGPPLLDSYMYMYVDQWQSSHIVSGHNMYFESTEQMYFEPASGKHLNLCYKALGDLKIFGYAAGAARTRKVYISGYKSGASFRTMSIGVSTTTDNVASFEGVDAYEFTGAVIGGLQSGATGARPVSPQTGQQYLDTTLGKPVWYDGSNWIDATGATV